MSPIVRTLAAIGLVAAVSACSQQGPETGARTLVDQWITQESRGYLRLSQFTVNEVVPGKRSGGDTYTVRYTLEAEALRDGGYLEICRSRGPDSSYIGSPRVLDVQDHDNCHSFQSQKGRRYRLDRAATFNSPKMINEITIARHERGWAIVEE